MQDSCSPLPPLFTINCAPGLPKAGEASQGSLPCQSSLVSPPSNKATKTCYRSSLILPNIPPWLITSTCAHQDFSLQGPRGSPKLPNRYFKACPCLLTVLFYRTPRPGSFLPFYRGFCDPFLSLQAVLLTLAPSSGSYHRLRPSVWAGFRTRHQPSSSND